MLLGSEEWAAKHGLPVLAYLTYSQAAANDFVGGDGLLMAPTIAVSKMLDRAGLKLQDFDFYEIHEAFAAQVLATLKAWEDPAYCKECLGKAEPLGVDRPLQAQRARLLDRVRASVRRDRRAHRRQPRQAPVGAAAGAGSSPSAPPAAWASLPSWRRRTPPRCIRPREAAQALDRRGEVCDAPARTQIRRVRACALARMNGELETVAELANELAGKLDLNASLRLWDGSRTPLGNNVTGPFEISIANAGVIGSLLRRPTLDNFIRHYVDKGIDFSGGTLIDLGSQLNRVGPLGQAQGPRGAARSPPSCRRSCWRAATGSRTTRALRATSSASKRKTADNKDYIQFHYDLSNEFYALFLDPEMVYSCAYYTDWNNGIAQAQADKLEMICRKLRLKPGERFLDIGCGWGGLICHAAEAYGVSAHGITLSQNQLEFARAKVKRLGLQDRVTIELMDYSAMSGRFDKIASIGMYEHIGLKNIPGYMQKMRGLLNDDGLFLNHAIARRAPKESWLKRGLRPEQRAIAKYIFPGGELDDIGHSLVAMERAGFEVQDVEAWRMHYARTCKLWCERLTAERATRDRVRGRGEIPHLGCVSGRRLARVLARHAAHLPDAGVEDAKAPAGAAAHARRPLPLTFNPRPPGALLFLGLQLLLRQLADHGLGQLVAELDDGRHLDLGDARLQVLEEVVGRARHPGFQPHEGLGRLAALGILDADDGDLGDGRVLVDRLLDAARIHVEARGDDEVLDAVLDVEEPVLVHARHIARAQELPDHLLGGLLRPLVIAEHHLRAP